MKHIDFASEIVRMVPMRQAAERAGLTVNRSGFASCPFHGETKPSLKIYDGTRGFCCFGCGKSGDVIRFVMDFYGLRFYDACKKLNDDFRLGLPIGEKLDLRGVQTVRKANRERMNREKREEAESRRIHEEAEHALDVWCACDRVLREAPPDSDLYAAAAREIDGAAYALEEAEGRLQRYEQEKRNRHCHTGMDAGRL